MARKGGGSTQRPAPPHVTNGYTNDNPPPSTIAAQIVHNASRTNVRQDPATKVSFGVLVKEFLQHPNTDESDDPQLVALICVIAEAGLEALFKDDPFAQDQRKQQEQGIDSIAALTKILERKPHLLLSANESDGQVNGSPPPPLFAWLFPKLLGLLTHATLQPLHEPARELLGLCLNVLTRTSIFWRHAAAVVRFSKAGVQDILNELDLMNDPTMLRDASFRVTLPSSSSIAEFWSESQHIVALPHDLQKTITSPIVAIYVGFNILFAFAKVHDRDRGQKLSLATSGHLSSWILDTCLALWQHFIRWTTSTNKDVILDEILTLYLHLLDLVALPTIVSEDTFSTSTKAALALVTSLAGLIEEFPLSSSSDLNQIRLASLFIRLRSISNNLPVLDVTTKRRQEAWKAVVLEGVEASVNKVCQNMDYMSGFHKDLQLSLCLWTSPDSWPINVTELRKELCSSASDSFSDARLAGESVSLLKDFRELNQNIDERPAKRRKTSPDSAQDINGSTYDELLIILNGGSQDGSMLDLSNLHNTVREQYISDADDAEQNGVGSFELQQLELLSALEKIACAGSRCLETSSNSSQHWKTLKCSLCGTSLTANRGANVYWNNADYGEDWINVIAAMLAITKERKFQKAPKSRVRMAVAIGRVFNHISDPGYLNLENCELGQWLLTSMRASLRELKIAATSSLMVFLRNSISSGVRQKNRRFTLEVIDAIASKDVISDQETIIMAYGQIARVCGEFEFPIILHRLIEYLEHTNALVCGMAYREIESLADEFAPDPLKLLSPYWRIIGFSAFKDVVKKPQKATQLADLTEQSVNQLLLLTQADVLPTLVLTGRREVVERIAKIRKASVIDVLTQPKKNTAKILALLLSQPVEDVAAEALKTLATIEPTIRERIGNKLEALITPDPDGIAVEILLLAADQDESKRKFFHRGFNTLAMLADSKSGQRKSKNRTLDDFLESHILGIITHLSNTIESPLAPGKTVIQPSSERKRCIAAIGELMTLARRSVNVALPQLRACLQSAMADSELVDETFSVWCAFLTALEADDVMLVVDQTFALIIQHWESFSEETQTKANKFIVDLTQQYDAPLRERIQYLPSLASIPVMSKTEGELVRLKSKVDTIKTFRSFYVRSKDQNAIVVRQALKELAPFLDANQEHLHQSVVGQKPIPLLATLTRSLLDASVRFSETCFDITVLCAQCLGIIGGLDPHRVETVREKKRLLVLTNFANRNEDINFVALLLEQVLVKVFLSTTNPKAQGWIAYVMQEMLRHSGFKNLAVAKPRSSQTSTEAHRWNEIPENVKNVLIPFLDSKYSININPSLSYQSPKFPIFNNTISHGTWLQRFVYDLLQKGQGPNVEEIFPVLARIIRGYDLSIATFILPFAALNVIVSDDEQNMQNVGRELLTVLESKIVSPDQLDASTIRQCSENVFQTLDYLSLWLQEKKKAVADARVMATKTGRGVLEDEEMAAIKEISRVEGILQMIPAEVISRRAVECGSYARALFHWEQYYRQQQRLKADTNVAFLEKDELLDHLQMIYAQIDEPDCMEGISAHLKVLNPEQQIIEDRKAGRWTAAQSWYEIALAEKPNDLETQTNLLTCLKESGQYDAILNYVDGFHASNSFSSSILPFAAEAAWSTGKWDQLERILATSLDSQSTSFLNFNVGVGQALLCLQGQDAERFEKIIRALRESVARSLSPSATVSMQACHDHMVKLHALYEIETISGIISPRLQSREIVLENLNRRLDIIGAYTSDKQYILGIRRAAMSSSQYDFTKLDIASAWLTTASLARKGGFINTAFNSVLHANRLGDNSSKIEYSKLLWKEGHHRKAIQNLRGAIASNAFQSEDITVPVNVSVTTAGRGDEYLMNRVKSHAQLLLAKWLDRAGQTQSQSLKDAYAKGVMSYSRWDKGHYYLARYYLKLLESEKKQPVAKQSQEYLSGSLTKLVIENFIRSTVYGTKYYYQTLPKVLTLWLDMGIEVMNNTPRLTRDKELHEFKLGYLEHLNKYLKRYANERMPAFAWYTAFPQIITRISHPNKNVWDALQTIIIRVASTYPQQALWSLLAVLHSTQDDRRTRGTRVLQLLRDASKKKGAADLKNMIIQGQRLTDGLLAACDAPVEQRVSHVSLSRDLGFSHKLAPSQLVVPIEANMLPNLPAGNDSGTIRRHNPFPQDAITINAFMDEVLVLSSLQRPRKVNVRGSDGRSYGLLCKPKDDLRKDQRLMEFNTMINRALQKDISSSKRRLYIKTYAVTPLNEECGTIEWVEGLKPMRDIIIRFYRQYNIPIDYTELRMLLNEASSSPSKVPIFTEKILGRFTPVLHEWFVETFPEPEAWFAARLRYTRSCAVMSIVGHVLGLGDRHGENVLLEQGDGGTFHVDFNCLFDKGLTFEKPELVPFRLTHNMVDAMGPQGVEGPFRKAAELTYSLLRQHEDTLITILETFVHDPTADFLGGRKRKKIAGVADTPQEVLNIVKMKVDGFMKGESVPLSVEGYVEALIAMAKDPLNLASMYIGWCAFF